MSRPAQLRVQFMGSAGWPARVDRKLFGVRYAYDQCGIWAFLALDTFFRMCNLQILKAVEKFDSRRLHHAFIFNILR
jgi:hypothetical protein